MFVFPCCFSLWEKFLAFGMTFQVLYSIIVNQKQRRLKLFSIVLNSRVR